MNDDFFCGRLLCFSFLVLCFYLFGRFCSFYGVFSLFWTLVLASSKVSMTISHHLSNFGSFFCSSG